MNREARSEIEPSKYRTAPTPEKGMPGGIPYIIGNEAAERFSFYGMKTILVVFMTKYLLDARGNLAPMSDDAAKATYHFFSAAVYVTPFLGAFLADAFFGKYRTILTLSIVYCLGHLALALDETRMGLFLGLGLIALGAGGIKPCVSAHVGDQFGDTNKHLLPKVMSWFYFAINLGALFSSLLTPILLESHGPGLAFGVPGVLMLLATIVFWLGRYKFVHVPAGGRSFFRELLSPEGLSAVKNLAIIYLFVAVFWSIFDQTGAAWVLQADRMDRTIDLGALAAPLSGIFPSLSQSGSITLLPSQIQAANPLLILALIPVFSYVIYPCAGRFVKVTPLRKIGTGFFVTVLAFALSAWIEHRIQAGQTPHVYWQLLAYFVLTAAEIMVSITGLEFSYTQAPKRMKSIVMAIWFLPVVVGNLFAGGVNFAIEATQTTLLEGAGYYWFFTIAMLLTAIGFVFVAANYRGQTYIQPEQPES